MIFKVPARCKTMYLNSPFYKGKLLWDKLQENVQKCGTVEEFVLNLKTICIMDMRLYICVNYCEC